MIERHRGFVKANTVKLEAVFEAISTGCRNNIDRLSGESRTAVGTISTACRANLERLSELFPTACDFFSAQPVEIGRKAVSTDYGTDEAGNAVKIQQIFRCIVWRKG
jgi:hypothetical protein